MGQSPPAIAHCSLLIAPCSSLIETGRPRKRAASLLSFAEGGLLGFHFAQVDGFGVPLDGEGGGLGEGGGGVAEEGIGGGFGLEGEGGGAGDLAAGALDFGAEGDLAGGGAHAQEDDGFAVAGELGIEATVFGVHDFGGAFDGEADAFGGEVLGGAGGVGEGGDGDDEFGAVGHEVGAHGVEAEAQTGAAVGGGLAEGFAAGFAGDGDLPTLAAAVEGLEIVEGEAFAVFGGVAVGGDFLEGLTEEGEVGEGDVGVDVHLLGGEGGEVVGDVDEGGEVDVGDFRPGLGELGLHHPVGGFGEAGGGHDAAVEHVGVVAAGVVETVPEGAAEVSGALRLEHPQGGDGMGGVGGVEVMAGLDELGDLAPGAIDARGGVVRRPVVHAVAPFAGVGGAAFGGAG